ncbi:osmotically-inducible protein OsmY [Nakamurella sp. UYEF19]|uniref:BON domain-containing protein n=1 Tax=Nakamurella sp. UYEF19 TaxID=1756392 RepID=UPI0033942E84
MTQTLKRTDAQLKSAVMDELSWLPSINSSHIGITADQGSITLTGQVDSYPEKVLAGKAALRVRGVSALAQEITVHTLYSAVTDTDIAREAVEALDRGIDVPETVKATVHLGVITLTGDVGWHYEREAALTAVHHLRGVTDVHNQIAIRPSVSVTGVKAEIEAAFIRNAQFEGEHVKVTTDSAGHITLEGNVRSWAERRQAEAVSFSAPGVTRITNKLHVQQY